jgi:hypothetical protein
MKREAKARREMDDQFDPSWLPPRDAAFLQKVEANDPGAVPWVLVRLLEKLGTERYVTARADARIPEQLDFDASSIHECKEAAAALWAIIASEHGEGEALRIFRELGRGPTKREGTADRNETLLYIYDLPPPLGGSVERLARQLAAANKYAAKQRFPKAEWFANGNQTAAPITRQINRLLESRRKTAEVTSFGRSSR